MWRRSESVGDRPDGTCSESSVAYIAFDQPVSVPVVKWPWPRKSSSFTRTLGPFLSSLLLHFSPHVEDHDSFVRTADGGKESNILIVFQFTASRFPII